jgi:hypothetical protein
MDLRFTVPELSALDQIGTEFLVAGVAEDELPPQGVAGLVDWRLSGRLSRLLERKFFRGALGEVLLLPARPRLPFDKVVLFGLGQAREFEEAVFRAVVERMLETLVGLKARSAVVELPGRHFGALPAERATDLLLESVGASRDHDVWTLVETHEAQRVITQHMIRERRRVRRL